MNSQKNFFSIFLPEKIDDRFLIWKRAHNIELPKLNLVKDFIISLYEIIDETYLGDSIILSENDCKGHFKWCWEKTLDNFSKEKIVFNPRGKHFDYLEHFFMEAYYYNKQNNKEVIIFRYINKLFNFEYTKTNSEMDALYDIYSILLFNLKKTN